MDEEFNWLEYSESLESAATESEVESGGRRGLRRFLPRLRLPSRPRLPRPSLPRIPRPSLPSLRRRRGSAPESQPGAAELLQGQVDRPVEQLDDRLRALRERSAAAPPYSAPAVNTGQPLYDVDELLTAPDLQQKPGGIISAAALSKAQQQQVDMLRDIVGGPAQSESGGGRGRGLPAFSLNAAPRILGTALLVLVVCLPFVSSDYAEGELPPSAFDHARHSAELMYNLLDNIASDDFILVGFEYGPAAAGELDMLADLVLRHIMAQRAIPLIVSSNPIAIVHAQNLIRAINRSLPASAAPLVSGEDYHLLRYLPGGAVGLRELRENFADVVRISAKGLPTGLSFESLEEMTEVVLIADSAEDVRAWVEQVAPQLGNPRLLIASGYAAQPLAQAYAESIAAIVGPVFGMRDAYTYGEKLEANFGALLPPEQPGTDPADEPEAEPEVELANVVADPRTEAVDDGSAQAELKVATAIPQATSTSLPAVAPVATSTSLPPTATTAPTETPAPTDTPAPTATEAVIRVVEITSDQRVNIRRGPTTVDDVLALGYTGDVFEVIGANGDGSWYNILLANGLEAWIAAFLVDEGSMTASELAGDAANASASAPRDRVVLQLDFAFRLGKDRPRFYQVQPPISGDRLEIILRRDRSLEVPRLNALTLGTLAAVLVIVLGNTIHGVGGLLRRRNRGG